nr:immunoglobulin heavy chain junction region [Mus musculus]
CARDITTVVGDYW